MHSSTFEEIAVNASYSEHIDKCLEMEFEPDQFQELYEAVYSHDRFTKTYGVIGIKKLLCLGDNSFIQLTVESGLIPKLIDFALDDSEKQLQLEATWALTNIAAGTSEQTGAVVEAGAIPIFILLLNSPTVHIAEQAAWAIGNIAADNAQNRDLILYNGVMEPLNKFLMEVLHNKDTVVVRQAIWTLSVLCRGTPLPNFALVKSAIPTFSRVLKECEDLQVLDDAYWALSHLSDGDDERIQIIIETGIVPTLVRHLDIYPKAPLLRTILNISELNHSIDLLLGCPGVVNKLFRFLSQDNQTIRRETCHIFAKICDGKSHQLQQVFAEPRYIREMIQVALHDKQIIRIEAAAALSIATMNASHDQIIYFVENGFLDFFCTLLNEKNVELLEMGLEAIYTILLVGENIEIEEMAKENRFIRLFKQHDVAPLLKKFRHYPHNKISALAELILTIGNDYNNEGTTSM